MSKQAKRARFYARQRTERKYLREVHRCIAAVLGCTERPWFKLSLPRSLARTRTHLGSRP